MERTFEVQIVELFSDMPMDSFDELVIEEEEEEEGGHQNEDPATTA